MKSVFAIPIGRGLCRVGIGDAESSEQLIEVIGAVRVHANRLGDHAVEIDRGLWLGAALLEKA